tara:strand:+ start:370 stop:678 length:309 start_codon:yes stop_codon:yes gene_type:complete
MQTQIRYGNLVHDDNTIQRKITLSFSTEKEYFDYILVQCPKFDELNSGLTWQGNNDKLAIVISHYVDFKHYVYAKSNNQTEYTLSGIMPIDSESLLIDMKVE